MCSSDLPRHGAAGRSWLKEQPQDVARTQLCDAYCRTRDAWSDCSTALLHSKTPYDQWRRSLLPTVLIRLSQTPTRYSGAELLDTLPVVDVLTTGQAHFRSIPLAAQSRALIAAVESGLEGSFANIFYYNRKRDATTSDHSIKLH